MKKVCNNRIFWSVRSTSTRMWNVLKQVMSPKKSVCNPFSIYKVGLRSLWTHLKKPLARCTGFETYCNYTEGGSHGPFLFILTQRHQKGIYSFPFKIFKETQCYYPQVPSQWFGISWARLPRAELLLLFKVRLWERFSNCFLNVCAVKTIKRRTFFSDSVCNAHPLINIGDSHKYALSIKSFHWHASIWVVQLG